ncbi:MAG: hypothetical protein JWN70_4537 [Planctomycetaceae bacterium]|nr:hypothetical protein [Planctomycetaceae bacterium]
MLWDQPLGASLRFPSSNRVDISCYAVSDAYKLEAQASAFPSNEKSECTRLRFELVFSATP